MNKEYPNEITVEVTDDDIKNGKPADFRHCAVALAASRVLGEIVSCGMRTVAPVSKDGNTIYLVVKEDREKMFNFIADFDLGKPISAITLHFSSI